VRLGDECLTKLLSPILGMMGMNPMMSGMGQYGMMDSMSKA